MAAVPKPAQDHPRIGTIVEVHRHLDDRRLHAITLHRGVVVDDSGAPSTRRHASTPVSLAGCRT